MAATRQRSANSSKKTRAASKSKAATKKATATKKQSASGSASAPRSSRATARKRSSKQTKRQEKAQSSRLWLMYPTRLITKPIIWQLGQKFDMVTNVRQASVTGEIGIVCLEIEGKRAEIDGAIKWLERQGIRVEPVEINVLDA